MSSHCPCPLFVPVPDLTNPPAPFEPIFCAVQFTFIVNDDLLACIYRDLLALSPTGTTTDTTTHISAYAQLRLDNCKQLVKLIPGHTPLNGGQTQADLQKLRAVLNKFCVFFQEDFVLLVEIGRDGFTEPLTEAWLQVLLYCKVDILAEYLDEAGFQVIETNNFELAKFILSHANIADLCPQNCALPCRPCVLSRPCVKRCPPKPCVPCTTKPCRKSPKCKPVKCRMSWSSSSSCSSSSTSSCSSSSTSSCSSSSTSSSTCSSSIKTKTKSCQPCKKF